MDEARRGHRQRSTNSELIFAGYGVEAPEFNWDDFKGVDVKGKTIVVLVNDPAVPDPSDPRKLDPKTFGGDAMTYYGRWTYKFEEGARKGAAGVLDRPRDGPGGLSVLGRPGQPEREVRSRHAGQEHGPRGHRRLGHARRGEEDPEDGRPGLRRAEEAGGHARLQAGAARAQGVARDPQHAAHDRLAQRRRQARRQRSRRSRTSTSSTRRTGITSASARR